MKRIGIVGALLFFIRCADFGNESMDVEESKQSTEKKSEEVQVIATTEMTIMPVMGFPEPFYGDTIETAFPIGKSKQADSIRKFELAVRVYYPLSDANDYRQFNTLVENLFKKYSGDHFSTDDDGSGIADVEAELTASDFRYEHPYAGVLFTEQSYVFGAAHWNHGYLSLHFDSRTGKEIHLTDVLVFKPGEAQKFCDAFNPDPTSEIANVVLEASDFSAERPFMTTYGELYLYFSDYEKGPSMTSIVIPYSKFKGYVNPDYKFLFEH